MILVFVFGVHYFLLIFPVQFLFDRDTMTLPMLIVLYIENIPNSLQVGYKRKLSEKIHA